MAKGWRGVLSLQGVESDDHRIIEQATWRELPLTLRIQTEDFGAHQGASPVGTIRTIEPAPGPGGGDAVDIMATGTFSDSPEGQLAAQWVGEQVIRGVSIDPGALDYVEEMIDPATGEVVPVEQIMQTYDEIYAAEITGDDKRAGELYEWLASLYSRIRFKLYEIAAATLVATPAFARCVIELTGDVAETDDQPAPAAAASTVRSSDVRAIFDRAHPRHAEIRDKLAKLGHDRQPVVAGFSPGRMVAAANVDRFREVPAATPDLPPLPLIRTAAAAPAKMHAEWFRPVETSTQIKFTITDDGRIMGHLFSWNSCHRSFTGRCERPERQSEFPDFHCGGEVALDDGSRMRIGVLTYAGLHAPAGRLSPEQMARVMENTADQLGPIRLYADEIGVQACGQVYDDVTPTQIARALAGFPSGDWRRPNPSSSWKLYGLHIVNTPGYPHYEEVDGEPVRMVASIAPLGPQLLAVQGGSEGACACGGAGGGSAGASGQHAACSCDSGTKLTAAALADLADLDRAMRARRLTLV